MTAVTNAIVSSQAHEHLRPFDIRRDITPVADLVERCFADTLDPDGHNYLRRMRSAAQNSRFMRWASAVEERVSIPLSGYVWEEDGRVVGNLTLIPFTVRGTRNYLIANVAVHPDYRRRGIARALTAKAIEQSRQRGAPSAWLHVREDNPGAIRLYQTLGFEEIARRTTWANTAEKPAPEANSEKPWLGEVKVVLRRSPDWQFQRTWLDRTYPPELTWHLFLKPKELSPGLVGAFHRFISGTYIWQWSAVHADQLLGVLAYQTTPSYADNLWLATPAQNEDVAAQALLSYARRHLPPHRPLALDYPSGRAVQAIQSAGFEVHQTLIWMRIKFRG
jgi:ribosomal protein S18 acetylase RimI-like enzyme